MRKLLDYDPLTGMSTIFDCDGETMTITHHQDVQPYLNVAAEFRSDNDRTKKGIKDDFVHYAIIPESVELEMRFKHGVNINRKEDHRKMFDLLNTDYRKFKTTEIMHSIKRG